MTKDSDDELKKILNIDKHPSLRDAIDEKNLIKNLRQSIEKYESDVSDVYKKLLKQPYFIVIDNKNNVMLGTGIKLGSTSIDLIKDATISLSLDEIIEIELTYAPFKLKDNMCVSITRYEVAKPLSEFYLKDNAGWSIKFFDSYEAMVLYITLNLKDFSNYKYCLFEGCNTLEKGEDSCYDI